MLDSPRMEVLQAEARDLLLEAKDSSNEEYKKSLEERAAKIDEEIKQLLQDNGHVLKHAIKSRLRYRRGAHYNEEKALLVKEVIDTLETRGQSIEGVKVSVGGSASAGAAVQIYRQGFDYLRENMDATGKYETWGRMWAFGVSGREVLVKSLAGKIGIISGVPVVNWRLRFSEFATSDDKSVQLSFSDLEQFMEFYKLITERYPVLKLTEIKGMTVEVAYVK